MRLILLAFFGLCALTVLAQVVNADASTCETLGDCATGTSWDVQIGESSTTIIIHGSGNDVRDHRNNNSSDSAEGFGVKLYPCLPGAATWEDVINCGGVCYECI